MALKNDNKQSNLDGENLNQSGKDLEKNKSKNAKPDLSKENPKKSKSNLNPAKVSQTTNKAVNAKQSQTTNKAKSKDDKNNFMDSGFINFLKDVRVEFRKIDWPSRPQVIQETWSVLVLVTMVTLFVLCVDWVLAHAFFSPLDAWARMHGGGIGLK